MTQEQFEQLLAEQKRTNELLLKIAKFMADQAETIARANLELIRLHQISHA